jgi:hypothetical protein
MHNFSAPKDQSEPTKSDPPPPPPPADRMPQPRDIDTEHEPINFE